MSDPQADATPLPQPDPGALDQALSLVEFLRARCSWDAAQTHRSLRRHLLEETHEVIDAIEAADDEALRDELGDLLLNLAFQVVLAEERQAFDRRAVVAGLQEKMRRRHPHLHGGEAAGWEEIKARETGSSSTSAPGILAGLEPQPDALESAERIQKRVARIGFDWPDASGAWEKVNEELGEVAAEFVRQDSARLEEEIGDLLFAIVNFARLAQIHPTTALRRANTRFARRFSRLEALAGERNISLDEATLEVLDGLWQDVKAEGG